MIIRVSEESAIKEALEEMSDFLRSQRVFGDALFRSKLVFSELVGNIFKHSSAQAEISSRVENGFVQLFIRSSDRYVPPKKSVCSDVYDENGRGLFLVDEVCFSREEEDGGVKVLIRLDDEEK